MLLWFIVVVVTTQMVPENFKQHNTAWQNTKVIMTDKDLQERSAIKNCHPDAVHLICLFHTLRFV